MCHLLFIFNKKRRYRVIINIKIDMLYNMAKDFVHANVLSTTLRDLVAKHAIQIEEPEE